MVQTLVLTACAHCSIIIHELCTYLQLIEDLNDTCIFLSINHVPIFLPRHMAKTIDCKMCAV
uniref:Uncharacterized protein n=1 Tax=Arundo donax TaxID=35708 RepID=A0A0A9F717_ARUDO